MRICKVPLKVSVLIAPIALLIILILYTITLHNKQVEYADYPELPPGYVRYGDGKWITDSEWSGFVIDATGVSAVPGQSKNCQIYKMTIYGTYDKEYTILPVYDWNGNPSTIPYDGHAFG